MAEEVIIIGAGIAGLMAARDLAMQGCDVIILEARDRVGGRIHTLQNSSFRQNTEAGAEFIHGDLPFTLNLLKQAGIGYHKFEGEMWEQKDGHMEEEDEQVETNSEMNQRLRELEEDMTVAAFLDKYFSGDKYAEMRQSVIRFIQGYEAADINKASMLAMRGDILEQDEQQYRTDKGYIELVDYLKDQCLHYGCTIHLNTQAQEIQWQKGDVTVITPKGNFTAEKLLVTVPLGVLQLDDNDENCIRFTPAIPAKINAARSLGFGYVIKVLIEFSYPFWLDGDVAKRIGKDTSEVGFIFSQQEIPTWWTQYPEIRNLLTGWLAGPDAEALKDTDDDMILMMAVRSLAAIFKMDKQEVMEKITAYHIANWGADKYTQGAYTYKTVNGDIVIDILRSPIDGTIFFAGEAVYQGPSAGTVEAALTSAVNVVKDMMGC